MDGDGDGDGDKDNEAEDLSLSIDTVKGNARVARFAYYPPYICLAIRRVLDMVKQ